MMLNVTMNVREDPVLEQRPGDPCVEGPPASLAAAVMAWRQPVEVLVKELASADEPLRLSGEPCATQAAGRISRVRHRVNRGGVDAPTMIACLERRQHADGDLLVCLDDDQVTLARPARGNRLVVTEQARCLY